MAVQNTGVARIRRAFEIAALAALATLAISALPVHAQTPAAAPPADTSSAAPPLPVTTPTESHTTVLTSVPNADSGPAIVQQPASPGSSPARPSEKGVLNPGKTADADIGVLKYRADGGGYLAVTDETELIGNVELKYNGYVATCDRATFDRTRHYLTLENNIVLTTDRQVVLADYVRLNTRTNEFVARGGRAVIPPDLIGQQIDEPLRISGETIAREGKNLVATNGLLTTCDFPNPHAKIGFAKATIIPNNRIVLRKAVLYRYDRAILRLNYLSLPIRDDIRYSYAPVVGKNNEEGYFVKNSIGYLLGNQLPGILRADYMSLKGVGIGFDQAYKFREQAAGTAILYGLYDKSLGTSSFNGRVAHQQRLGDTLLSLNTDFQNNSYNAVTSNSTSETTSLTLNRTVGPGATTVNLGINGSSSGGGSGLATSDSKSYQYGLTQAEKIGQSGNVSFMFNGTDSSTTSAYNGTSSSSGTIQRTGEIHATDTIDHTFDIGLNSNRILESRRTGEGSGSYYSGTQSLPELTLGTDTKRLGWGVFAPAPTKLTIAYGNYLNSTSVTTQAQRTQFDAVTNPKPIFFTPGGWLTLTSDGEFKQSVYRSDYTETVTDTATSTTSNVVLHNLDYAEYVIRGDGTLTQKLGGLSNLNLTYNYLRPYGAAPQSFLSDQPGSANALGTNLSVDGAHVKLTLRTGYDIQESERKIDPNAVYVSQRAPWQQVTTSLAFKPNDVLQSRFDASYNINTGRLLTATNNTRIRGRNDFALDTGLQFDPLKKRFPQITETLTTPLFSRDLRLTAQSGYNDESHMFYYKEFGLVRSFHDYEYVFTYHDQPYGLRTDKGFTLFIRLKAFPFNPTSSTSQFGTALSGSSGPVF